MAGVRRAAPCWLQPREGVVPPAARGHLAGERRPRQHRDIQRSLQELPAQPLSLRSGQTQLCWGLPLPARPRGTKGTELALGRDTDGAGLEWRGLNPELGLPQKREQGSGCVLGLLWSPPWRHRDPPPRGGRPPLNHFSLPALSLALTTPGASCLGPGFGALQLGCLYLWVSPRSPGVIVSLHFGAWWLCFLL